MNPVFLAIEYAKNLLTFAGFSAFYLLIVSPELKAVAVGFLTVVIFPTLATIARIYIERRLQKQNSSKRG